MRIRLVHWRAGEAGVLLDALQAAGHQVDYDEQLSPETFRVIRHSPPDVFVIDLSRLPSHGREVATYIRGQKNTRQIPILFLDGAPGKVEAISQLLPDAVYAPQTRLRSALRQALQNRPASPVVPAQMMARYTGRTAAQKLGIREGCTVVLINAPRDCNAALGELPPGAALDETGALPGDVTLWFVDDAAVCAKGLPEMRRLARRTKLWIVWRKGCGVTPRFLRESAAALGLVDYKICAVDANWSAMLFAHQKSV